MLITIENIENYKKYLEKEDKAQKTISSYITDVKRIFKIIQEKFDNFIDVTEKMVKETINEIFNSKKLSASTLNRQKHGWNSFCKFIGMENFFIKKKINKTTNIRKKVIDNIDVRKMLNFYDKNYLQTTKDNEKIKYLLKILAINLGYNEGLRVSEYRNIKFSDIDTGYISILNSKHNNYREVPISEYTSKIITKLKNLYSNCAISQNDYIFMKNNGNFISNRTFQRWIKNVAINCGVKEELAKSHGLRHRFAYNFLQENKEGLVILSGLMGHKSIETTKLYLNYTLDEVKLMINKACKTARKNKLPFK